MATHPFAIKLEKAIEHAKRMKKNLLDAIERAKHPPEPRPHRGPVDLGLLGIGGPRVTVTPGGGLGSSSRADAMKKDRTLKELMKKYAKELAKCAAQREAMRGPGGTTQISDGTNAPIRRPEVSLPCPAATAAAKAISAYIAAHYGGSGRSGGGGGGGW